MRQKTIALLLSALPAFSFAGSMPFVATIGGKTADVFVSENPEGRFVIAGADAAKFGGRSGLAGEVTLENTRIDRNAMAIEADLPFDAMAPVLLGAMQEKTDVLPQVVGGWLNYSLDAKKTNSGIQESLLADLNLSLSKGVFRHLYVVGTEPGITKRLQTYYTLDFPGLMLTATAGDAFSSSYAHGAGQKFAGLQLRKNYALDPSYIYSPTVSLAGSAKAPSVFEVFEGNRKISSGSIERGEFALQNYASVQGTSGQIKMIVRDAQGNEQIIHRDLFTAPGALKPGEFAYAVDLGLAYSSESSISSDLYASVAGRYGFNWLTIEGGADATAGRVSYFGGGVLPTALGAFSYRHVGGQFSDATGNFAPKTTNRFSWDKRFQLGSREGHVYASALSDGGKTGGQVGGGLWSEDWNFFGAIGQTAGSTSGSVGASKNINGVGTSVSLSQNSAGDWSVGLQLAFSLGTGSNYFASVGKNRSGAGAYGVSGETAWSVAGYTGRDQTEVVGAARRDFERARGELYLDGRSSGELAARGRISGSVVATADGVTFARPVTAGGVLLVDTAIPGVPVNGGGNTHVAGIGTHTVVTNLPTFANVSIAPDFDKLDPGYTALSDRLLARIPRGISRTEFGISAPGFFAQITFNGRPLERGVQFLADGQAVVNTSAGAYLQPRVGAKTMMLEIGKCKQLLPVPAEALTKVNFAFHCTPP